MNAGGALDPELLAGFRAEIASYLPAIRQGLDEFAHLGGAERLTEPHRLVHTIKGAASMLGLAELAEVAREGEETLAGLIAAESSTAAPAVLAGLGAIVERIAVDGEAPAQEAPGALAGLPAEAVAEVMAGFRVETDEQLQTASRLLRELARAPGEIAPLADLRRVLHTCKGASAVVGFRELADVCHRLEDLALAAQRGPRPLPPTTVDGLFAGLAEMELLVHGEAAAEAPFEMPPPASPAPPVLDSASPSETAGAPAPAPAAGRADLGRLQQVLHLSGDLMVNHAAFEERALVLRRQLQELDLAVARLRQVARQIEGAAESRWVADRPAESEGAAAFDPLELDRYSGLDLLSRSLAENASDLSAVARDLAASLGGAEADRRELKRVTRGLQEQMLRLRLAPLGGVASRLDRTVRATAARLGKRADLALLGAEVELDRTVLQGVVDPLLHLLRNAVGHGIEAPDVRRARGKPERGRIEVRARIEGSQIVIEVADDGGGLDWRAIEAAAARSGVAASGDLLFAPGFTTVPEASDVAGRGVGLDVVKTEVERLRGTVAVESKAGAGTTFTLRLPQSLAVARVVLMRAAGETFGVPAANVALVLHEGEEFDEEFPLRDLAELLGLPPAVGERGRGAVVLVKAGARRLALRVDELAGVYDAVVGGLGTLLRRVHGVSGAAVAADGRLLLVLNPAELLAAPRLAAPLAPRAEPSARRSALVVDDSLSVRQVLSALLRAAGWEVQVARDGREALEQLQAATVLPSVAVVDVEMPRMNGFELLRSVRREPALAALPIVMLTSRAGDKHRDGAMTLGADAYLVKPYDDAQLLATLARLARAAEPHA